MNTERNILVDNITKERKAWREKIREKSIRVFDSYYDKNCLELKKLKTEFQLMLNPHDKDDKEILDHFTELIENCEKQDDSAINNFIVKLSLLLKHDWERAKKEANPVEYMGMPAERTNFTKYQEDSIR